METHENWRNDAVCKDLDPNLFFPPASNVLMNKVAKNICRQCPVNNDCLLESLSNQEPYGVWGGISEVERDALIHKQKRVEAKRGRSVSQPRAAGQIAVGA